MKQKHFIDSHKLATGLFVLLMMALYDQWQNPTLWLYLALHGTYGVLWALKSRIFPDASWEQPASLGYGLYIWFGLSLYWITPWLIAWRGIQAPAAYQALCVSLYSFGVFFHFAADMQKWTALRLAPGRLICDGMMSLSRNINYFGELLIYGGFGLLAMHWAPLLVLAFWVALIWIPRMRRKDQSLSRLPGFAEYRRRTKFFIPFVY